MVPIHVWFSILWDWRSPNITFLRFSRILRTVEALLNLWPNDIAKGRTTRSIRIFKPCSQRRWLETEPCAADEIKIRSRPHSWRITRSKIPIVDSKLSQTRERGRLSRLVKRVAHTAHANRPAFCCQHMRRSIRGRTAGMWCTWALDPSVHATGINQYIKWGFISFFARKSDLLIPRLKRKLHKTACNHLYRSTPKEIEAYCTLCAFWDGLYGFFSPERVRSSSTSEDEISNLYY